MSAIAEANGSVISSRACSGRWRAPARCPSRRRISRRRSAAAGKGVEASLRAFAAGRERAVAHAQAGSQDQATAKPPLAKRFPRLEPIGHADYDALVARARQLPADLHGIVAAGLQRVVDYQDVAYGREYLDRLETMPRDATGLMQAFARSISPSPWPMTT